MLDRTSGALCPPERLHLVFSTNSALSHGGGLYITGGTTAFTNVVFSGNMAATSGGGIFNEQADVTLVNASFLGNQANRVAPHLTVVHFCQ